MLGGGGGGGRDIFSRSKPKYFSYISRPWEIFPTNVILIGPYAKEEFSGTRTPTPTDRHASGVIIRININAIHKCIHCVHKDTRAVYDVCMHVCCVCVCCVCSG